MAIKRVNHQVGAGIFLAIAVTLLISLIFLTERYYKMAIIGTLVWSIWKFSNQKNEFDKLNAEFDYLRYLDHEWDNMAMSATGIIFVNYLHDLVGIFSAHVKEIEFYEIYYYAPGFLADKGWEYLTKLRSWKSLYTPPTAPRGALIPVPEPEEEINQSSNNSDETPS